MTKDKLEKYYSNYGKITWVEENKKMDADIYVFDCDIKTILPDEEVLISIDSVPFVIVTREKQGKTVIFCFKIASKDSFLGDSALEILNSVNKDMVYGKFTVDNDGDIDWEYTYESERAEEENIKDYLKSCLLGIMDIVILSLEEEQKKEQKSERSAENKK